MIDYHKTLVSTLQTVLPTHYEMTLTSKTPTPCISYMELNNNDEKIGDTFGYCNLTYQVKIWANDIGTIQKYVPEVDKALKEVGFKRISSNEMYDRQSTMIQKILTYEVLAVEIY